MANVMNFKVVVLWEHELIKAAKTLEKFSNGQTPTAEDAENMLRACYAAIYSPELTSGEYSLTVMSAKETVMTTKTEIVAK